MDPRPTALLIQPPIYDFAAYDLYVKPFGLSRVGGWLAEAGWRTEYLNALDYADRESTLRTRAPKRKPDGTGKFHRQVIEKPAPLAGVSRNYARYGVLKDVLEKRIESSRPDAVFIATGMTYWYPGVAEVAASVRRAFPSVPLFAGGVYATLLPGHLHRIADIDHVIPGEGLRKMRTVLEELGFPVPSGAPANPDQAADPFFTETGILRLNSGCPFACTYCASRILCGGFSPGNPDASIEYFLRLYRMGTRNFAFYDDALLFKKEEVLVPFLKGVMEAAGKVNFYTPNAVHVRYIDRETAGLMIRSGFRELRIGFESADSGFHEVYDRKFTLSAFHEKIKVLKEAGFSRDMLRVYILAGLPGQNAAEVEESLRYASRSGVLVTLARYSPVPGTALWKESVRKSIFPLEEEPLFHNNTFFSMEWEGFTREEMQRLQDLTVKLNAGEGS